MTATHGRSGGDRSLGLDTFPADGIPTMPKGRSKAFESKWVELLAQLPAESLRRIDGHQITILVSLLVHSDELAGMLEIDCEDHKSRRLFIQTSQQISRLSSLFGLSIRDRQSLKLEPAKVDDDFERWQNGTGTTCSNV